MPDTTHVCEIRFNNLSAATAQVLQQVLEFAIIPHCREFEIQFHPVARIAEWRSTAEGDKPGSKQLWFLDKNLGELDTLLRTAVGNGFTDPDIDLAKTLHRYASEARRDPELTRRDTSQIIDAIIGAIQDIKFLMTKEVATNE